MGKSGLTNPNRSRTQGQGFDPFDDSDEEGARNNGHDNVNNIREFSSDSDDSEDPVHPDTEDDVNIVTRGYVMVNWESENENDPDEEGPDSVQPDAVEAALDNSPMGEHSEDSTERQEASGSDENSVAASSIVLNETQADLIKNIMTKISLPATAFPPWASAISDEELKNIANQLLEKK